MKPHKIFVLLVAFTLSFVLQVHAQTLEYGPAYVIHDENFSLVFDVAIDPMNDKVFLVDAGRHLFYRSNISDLLGAPVWSEFAFIADRTSADALKAPQGIAVDAVGNVLVADSYNHQARLYRWDTATSTYLLDNSFASSTRTSVIGTDIGTPRDIAVGPDGKVYLLDSDKSRILVADDINDTSWSVFYSNSNLGNPYGFAIASDNTVYIADTDNHQIIQLSSTGSVLRTIGHFGTGYMQFRSPRDVDIDRDGKIYVADTYNHRVQILRPDGRYYKTLGLAPRYSFIQKILVDVDKRVYVVDSDNKSLIYYPDPDAPRPYDAYIRDYDADTGAEPSDAAFTLSSPDILIRHCPDIDPATAATVGLTTYANQQPLFERNNYIYIAVHNRGTQPINNTVAKVYWADPGSLMNFPVDWKSTGFYDYYIDATNQSERNFLSIPLVDARREIGGVETDGVQVIGPIIWRPPAPETSIAGDGNFYMTARLINIDDPSAFADGLNQVHLNNNIALRSAEVIRGEFDNIPPVITCPVDVTISCELIDVLAETGMATAVDNFDPTPDLAYQDIFISGDCNWECIIERVWTATDGCGNVSTCVQVITRTALPLIEEALNMDMDGDLVADPIILGFSTQTLTIEALNAPCVVQWMPVSGETPAALGRGNFVTDAVCNIENSPIANGKIVNPLLGEVLSLSINVRLNPELGETPLSEMDCTFDPFLDQWLRPSSKPTVNRLLRLANIVLGNLTGPTILDEILEAVECINGTFNKCDSNN